MLNSAVLLKVAPRNAGGAAYSDHPDLLFTGPLIRQLGSSLAESTDTASHTIDHLARLARQIGNHPELFHHDDGDAQECADLAADHLQHAATAQRDAAKSIDDATSSLRCMTAPRALGFVPEMADEIDVADHLLAGTWYLPLEVPACGTVASVPAEATNDGVPRRFICDRPADHRATGNPKHRHVEDADTAHCVEWTGRSRRAPEPVVSRRSLDRGTADRSGTKPSIMTSTCSKTPPSRPRRLLLSARPAGTHPLHRRTWLEPIVGAKTEGGHNFYTAQGVSKGGPCPGTS